LDRRTFLKTLTVVGSAGFARGATAALPSFPEQGAPILFDSSDYPINQWRSKSSTAFPWFKEEQEGWYVDWDAEAGPLTHLIVHHTVGIYTPDTLSRLHKATLYGDGTADYSVYRDENYKTPYVVGLPMHSAHVMGGRETFAGYHIQIEGDGGMTGILNPHRRVEDQLRVCMIGWHAGNWAINCHSVAVALAGNFQFAPPPDAMLAALDGIVEYYLGLVPKLIVAPHRAVSKKRTECPGMWFNDWAVKRLKPENRMLIQG
jgi:hypothetical protein